MKVPVTKLVIISLLGVFLIACAGMPIQPEKISILSEQEAFEQLFWGMRLPRYYVGWHWQKTSKEEFMKKITGRIFELYPEWDQQTRTIVLDAALKDPEFNLEFHRQIRRVAGYKVNEPLNALVLRMLKDPRASGPFLTAIGDKGLVIVAQAYPAFIRMGEPSTEVLLIKALQRHGHKRMAGDFLYCGNSRLHNAARERVMASGENLAFPGVRRDPRWGTVALFQDFQQLKTFEGIVVGSIIVQTGYELEKKPGWGVEVGKSEWYDYVFCLTETTATAKALVLRWYIEVVLGEEKIFVSRFREGEYEFSRVLTSPTSYGSEFVVRFAVAPGKTTYIGRLVYRIPKTLYADAASRIIVEDAQDSTIEAIKEEYVDEVKEVTKNLMRKQRQK